MSAQEYLARPSGDCCTRGTIHDGHPRGNIINIADIETYVSKPPEGKANGNIILYFPDVWGLFNNAQLVMDAFAAAGFLVLGLDYFRGDPVTKHRKDRHDTTTEPGFDYEGWKDKHIEFADQAVPRWVEKVKEDYGRANTKFACVGYCFGAPYVCNELSQDGICSVGAFAHPAFLKDHHIERLSKPLFLSCAETDHTFSAELRNHAVEILSSTQKIYHLQLFSCVEHGFALRGDMKNPYERWVKEQSLNGILDWFDYWLAR